MKYTLKLIAFLLTCVIFPFAFTSCGDNDEIEEDTTENETVSRPIPGANIEELFPYGSPKQIGNLYFSYDNQGRLATVKNGNGDETQITTFNYSPSGEYDMVMTHENLVGGSGNMGVSYFKLNENGFTNYFKAVGVYRESLIATVTYNADGQISSINYEEHYSEHTTTGHIEITYANGDITKVEDIYVNDGVSHTEIYNYVHTDIENKSGLMFLDSFYDIDLEEIEYAYFAGIFGKAPYHLIATQNSNSDGYKYSKNYTWTLDNQGLPVIFNDGYDDYKIVW